MTNPEQKPLEIEPGIYEIQENGDMYKLDFDITKNEDAIKNKIEEKKDMSKDEKKEESTEDVKEDTEDAMDEKKKKETFAQQTVNVCKKEYDFLKAQSEELKALKAEKSTVEEELKSFKADFTKLKESIEAEKAAKIEAKRQEKIKQISKDFTIPEEKLADKSLDMLEQYEEMLDLAIKRESNEQEDFTPSNVSEDVEKQINDMKKNYKMVF